jgi:hypothetical protein
MGPFLPAFQGRFTPGTDGRAFLARVARRVEAGFLSGGPHFRSRYSVVSQAADRLVFRSEGFWSDYNVGLNDVTLRLAADGAVEYEVSFWRWLRIGVIHGGSLGALLVTLYLLPLPEPWSIPGQLSRQLPAQPASAHAIFWGSIAWWCLLWPWVLAALHRGPARRCLERILAEVDASGPAGTGARSAA